MRYIIYGAGGIGCTIGARLFQHGRDVLLIARGAHMEAIRKSGLDFRSPDEKTNLSIPCVGHPSEIDFGDQDVVLLTMKSQHTIPALLDLRQAAGDQVPVFCCQNGVANEREALRRFQRVYGMVVVVPATFLVPGTVRTEAKGVTGILDAGRYPAGIDATAQTVTSDLADSSFSSLPDPHIMKMKYAKLLWNLNNAAYVLCGPEDTERMRSITQMLRREAQDCYRAAGIEWTDDEAYGARKSNSVQMVKVDGEEHRPSAWQSVARQTGSIEADFFNGEIVLLGRMHGVRTPANHLLQRLANRLVSQKEEPGSWSLERIMGMIDRA